MLNLQRFPVFEVRTNVFVQRGIKIKLQRFFLKKVKCLNCSNKIDDQRKIYLKIEV